MTLDSVIVATRNRSALLEQTLDALSRQDWPPERLEIIVADNGSVDDTRTVVQAQSARGISNRPAVRYLTVETPGKSHAVNAALAIARGEILAFTDDDVRPDPEWVRQIVK